jgi:NAD(P)-dependent dehydrogenase (short-subunit alcohol dehydrogenase family)
MSALTRREFLEMAAASGVFLFAALPSNASAKEKVFAARQNKERKEMDLQLKGKRALVTGSTSGIGESIAKLLAANGAVITVHGRSEERGKKVVKAITDKSGKAFLMLGDLRVDEQAARVVNGAVSAMGGVDILVNNAGAYHGIPWLEVTPEKWADTYNNNVISMVRMVNALAPEMKKRKWGRIINISSSAGTMAYADGEAALDYSACKAAVTNYTAALARALAGSGVTVTAVSPGGTRTPGFMRAVAKIEPDAPDADAKWNAFEKSVFSEAAPKTPVHRFGRPEDIANVVVLLASPLSDWVSGDNYRVDGGWIPVAF